MTDKISGDLLSDTTNESCSVILSPAIGGAKNLENQMLRYAQHDKWV